MTGKTVDEPTFLFVVSALILLAVLLKASAHRYLRVPPVVGYIGLGLALRSLQQHLGVSPEEAQWTLSFLAELGVASLLFRVGLQSDVRGLVEQLPRAVRIWGLDVLASAGLAFATAMAFGLGLVPALFLSAGLSATSVGIAVTVWEDAKRMKTKLGELLLDVAELDDLSAVLLMLTVVAAAPALRSESGLGEALVAALGASGWMLAKVIAFAALCWLFAHFLEGRITAWLARAQRPPDRVLSIVGVAFGVAAVAGMIGFSVAVGALFAGLMFSRDATAVHEEASFRPIHALFTPFFFIDIGYALNPGVMASSFWLGALVLLPAVLGKLCGVGLPVLLSQGTRAGLLMGVSMLPRAEIALLIARTGNRMGPWAVPDELYGAIVIACSATAVLSPLVLSGMFKRMPNVAR